jgi:EpsI family protein
MKAHAGDRLAAGPAVAARQSANLSRLTTELAVVLVVGLLLAPTLVSLRLAWIDTDALTYTHGYLICAVCLWLLVRTAREPASPIAPDLRFAVPLVALSLCWLLALRAGIELLHQVLFPAIVLTALCAATGFCNGVRQWFACAYFYFAVPVWTIGTGILQGLSTIAVKIMLRLTGIPAHVDGNVVQIPEGMFEIAGGCSGIHYFIVSLALAAIYGEIHRDSLKVRLRLLVLAAVLAMVANWIRIYVVIVAGHLTNMQHYFVRVDHYVFGWALYAVAMGVFFWLASRAPVGGGREIESPPFAFPWPRRAAATGVVLAFAATAVGPALGMLSPVRAADVPARSLLAAEAGWEGPATASGPWRPDYPRSDRSELAEYRRDGVVVSAFVAEYDSQRQGKELVGFENSLLAGLAGEVVERRNASGAYGDASWLRVAPSERNSNVVLFYYDVGGTRRTSALAEQLTYGIASLSGPQLSRIVAVEATCATDCAQASALASELLHELYPQSETRLQ